MSLDCRGGGMADTEALRAFAQKAWEFDSPSRHMMKTGIAEPMDMKILALYL